MQVEIVTPLTIVLPKSGLPANRELLAMEAVTLRAGARTLKPWSFDVKGQGADRSDRGQWRGQDHAYCVAMGLAALGVGPIRRAEEADRRARPACQPARSR